MTDSSTETGVSCGQLVFAAVLPCSILMDARSEGDDGLTETFVGVSQMTQLGNALKQARVQYYWWIECYSEQYVGDVAIETMETLGTDHKRHTTHQASQKGMLRCVDASQPMSSPTTTKSVIMLTCGAKVQIDPAFLAEYSAEREKFFSENTQDKHQARREHFILVGEDGKTISDEELQESIIQGEIMLDGRKTTLPSVTRNWDYEDGKPDKNPSVTSNEANHMVKLGESAKPCMADWQCTAMLA